MSIKGGCSGWFLALVLFCHDGKVQDIRFDRINKKSGAREIETLPAVLNTRHCAVAGLGQSKDVSGRADTSYALAFYFIAATAIRVEEKALITITFEDETELNFQNGYKTLSTSEGGLTGVLCVLSSENITDLLIKPVRRISIPTSAKKYDFYVDREKREKIGWILRLVMERMTQPFREG